MLRLKYGDWILAFSITPLGPGAQQGLKRPTTVHKSKLDLIWLWPVSFFFYASQAISLPGKDTRALRCSREGFRNCLYKLCYVTVMISGPVGCFLHLVGPSRSAVALQYMFSTLGLLQMEPLLPWAAVVIRTARSGQQDLVHWLEACSYRCSLSIMRYRSQGQFCSQPEGLTQPERHPKHLGMVI